MALDKVITDNNLSGEGTTSSPLTISANGLIKLDINNKNMWTTTSGLPSTVGGLVNINRANITPTTGTINDRDLVVQKLNNIQSRVGVVTNTTNQALIQVKTIYINSGAPLIAWSSVSGTVQTCPSAMATLGTKAGMPASRFENSLTITYEMIGDPETIFAGSRDKRMKKISQARVDYKFKQIP